MGEGSPVASPMPKSVLPMPKGRMFCVPFTDGVTWYIFIAYAFPNYMVVRILFHLMGVFSAFIVIGLIRDNEGAVY